MHALRNTDLKHQYNFTDKITGSRKMEKITVSHVESKRQKQNQDSHLLEAFSIILQYGKKICYEIINDTYYCFKIESDELRKSAEV